MVKSLRIPKKNYIIVTTHCKAQTSRGRVSFYGVPRGGEGRFGLFRHGPHPVERHKLWPLQALRAKNETHPPSTLTLKYDMLLAIG